MKVACAAQVGELERGVPWAAAGAAGTAPCARPVIELVAPIVDRGAQEQSGLRGGRRAARRFILVAVAADEPTRARIEVAIRRAVPQMTLCAAARVHPSPQCGALLTPPIYHRHPVLLSAEVRIVPRVKRDAVG